MVVKVEVLFFLRTKRFHDSTRKTLDDLLSLSIEKDQHIHKDVRSLHMSTQWLQSGCYPCWCPDVHRPAHFVHQAQSWSSNYNSTYVSKHLIFLRISVIVCLPYNIMMPVIVCLPYNILLWYWCPKVFVWSIRIQACRVLLWRTGLRVPVPVPCTRACHKMKKKTSEKTCTHTCKLSTEPRTRIYRCLHKLY